MNPEAIYDSLLVGSTLEGYLDDFAKSEVQIFCYLACLLSLYEGNPTTFWEYNFIKNEIGAPYSDKIDYAIDELINRNLLIQTNGEFYKISDDGCRLLNNLDLLHQNQKRKIFLITACNSLITVPFGQVRDAINNEPLLKLSKHIGDKRILNNDKSVSIELLYSQFKNLKSALSDKYSDLTIPALVWLYYLIENK